MKFFSIKLFSSNFLILTTIFFFLSYSTIDGKVPDYIQVCKRNDPDITKCIENSISKLKPKLVEGIPELDVPAIDPLLLKKLSISLGSGFETECRNLTMTGGKNFEIRDFLINMDDDSSNFTFTVIFPEISGEGTYLIDAKIGTLPLKGNGPIHLVARSSSGKAAMFSKKITRGGKNIQWFYSMNLKLDVSDYNIKLENLFQGDPTLESVTNKLLNEEKTEVLASLLPGLEKALIDHFLLTINNVCKHFTWEELMPLS